MGRITQMNAILCCGYIVSLTIFLKRIENVFQQSESVLLYDALDRIVSIEKRMAHDHADTVLVNEHLERHLQTAQI